MKRIILRFSEAFVLLLGTISVSCSLFEYHPYETNVPSHRRGLNAKAIEKIVSTTPQKDTVTLIAMGDTQRFYDEVEDFVTSANQVQADFVILNGDITDFGLKDEFEWIDDIMRKLNKPYISVIGNHDLSGNGEELYEKIYGPLNSSFVINGFKFVLLNTNSREYKFNGRVPDIAWLQSQLETDDFQRAVVVAHIPPYDSDFDPDLEHEYARTISQSGKVNLSLHGHTHAFDERVPYDDGMHYLVSTSMNERMYLVVKIFGNGFSYEKIYY